jgi:exonuclease SbcD
MAAHCPVLMLRGTYSHEPPGTSLVLKSLGGRYPVHVAYRIGQAALMPNVGWQVSGGWRSDGLPAWLMALFSCAPTVNKAAVAATVGAGAAAEAVGEDLVTCGLGLPKASEGLRPWGCRPSAFHMAPSLVA